MCSFSTKMKKIVLHMIGLFQSQMIVESPGMNYSVTGFELILTRKMSFYIVTYYLPSGNTFYLPSENLDG